MNSNVLCAVFKRNFVNYFANPTGYVFICVFLLLSSCAAFRPSEFFVANLANLDALNSAITLILLFFVPAITMGVWADESRQGTDELLLTIPAGDLEIVLGKYLASVAIYSVSLAVSAVSNFIILRQLGEPDPGLFFSNYLGYWFLGLAMLAIGMVASFLTRNITVAYILGAVLNALMVLTWYADTIPHAPLFLGDGRQAMEPGRPVPGVRPRDHRPAGIALLPDDRRRHAVLVHGADRPPALEPQWLVVHHGIAFHCPRRGDGGDGGRRWSTVSTRPRFSAVLSGWTPRANASARFPRTRSTF